MKNFAKLLVVALAVAIVASLFALSSSAAAAEPAAMIDPNDLKPGSERVIFIKDAPRDENNQIKGELEGDGTGSDAANPLIPNDHESFDPTAQYPKYHLQTAFYQATELLKDEGGTIVVCGPVFFGIGESYGSGASTRDVFTAKFGENTIKITSVYNGVDYRKEAGAKIIIENPAEIGMYGQSIWENIDIATASSSRVISFSNFATLIGEGVNCYPTDDAFEGVAANYVSISGGHRYSGGVDLTCNLVVKSGTYNCIVSGEWGVNTTRKYNTDGDPTSGIKSTNNLDGNTKAVVVLEGTTKVYGQVVGTNKQNCEFSGNTTITINGGTYECDINMGGSTGFLNTDAVATLIINGGNFENVWSINDAIAGFKNNAPAVSKLDFSGWKGEKLGLAQAFGMVTTFTDVILPTGVTQQELVDLLNAQTEAPVVPETTVAPVETQKPAEETKAPAVEDTKAPAVEETKDTTPVTPDDEKGGSNIGLIIGIVAAVVVIAVIAVVVLKKKK